MTCEKTLELMSDYLDGCLSWHENIEIENHISLCSKCSNELTELIKLSNRLKSLPDIELPDDFHSNLMDKCKSFGVANKKKSFSFLRFRIPTFAAAFLFLIVIIGLYNIIPEYPQSHMIAEDIYAPQSAMLYTTESYPPKSDESEYDIGNELFGDSAIGIQTTLTNESEMAKINSEAGVALEESLDSDLSTTDELRYDDAKTLSKEDDKLPDNSLNITQKIIKNAFLSLEVNNFDQTVSQLKNITNNFGGYVDSLSSNVSYLQRTADSKEIKNGYITLKIPSEKYENAKDSLAALGNVVNQTENTQDITMQYIDRAARLSVKKAEEKRLINLIEKAEKVEDLILLEERLANIRSEIESIEMQLNNWDKQVLYSTIEINLTEKETYERTNTTNVSFGEQMLQGVKYSFASACGKLKYLSVLTAQNIISLMGFALIIVVAYIFVNLKKKRKKD